MDSGSGEKDETVREVQVMQSKYWVCMTCGSLTSMVRGLCTYCSSPLPNFLHSPQPQQVSRGIHLGFLHDGSEFRIPMSHFGFHFAFYGATGGGKTRAAINLAIEAENAGMKLLVLDVEGEWKDVIANLKSDTEYYSTDKNLRINPYDLGDYGLVKILLRETIFHGIEVEYQDLSAQMNYVLDKCIQNSTSIPTLIDNVMSYEERDLPFRLSNIDKTKTALLVRLEPYKSNPALNEIFYTETSSINFDKLDSKNIIIDLHSLEALVAYRTELRLIYNAIAIGYLKLALSRQITNSVSNLFIADEAQLLVPKILRKVVITDTHLTAEFASRLRKRGQSIAIVTQSPSNLESILTANCQNAFVFRLQDANDIELIARSAGYNWHSLDFFTQELTNLKRKQALVKTPLVDEPFIITAPDVVLNPISQEELDRHSPKIPIENYFVRESAQQSREKSDDEESFLRSIAIEPFISARERRHLLGWDDKRYANAVGSLVRRGEIEIVKMKLGKGKPRILYQKKGANPGVLHEASVDWLAKRIRAIGIECITSKIGPDIQIPSRSLAINVETGKSDVEGNIWIALASFSKVIICSDDERLLKQISERHNSPNILCSQIAEVPALCS